ncbi:hypothetical protein EXN66_Car003223 [Channa argus]|uniref:Uncharacterized protein n=1 Tax=Channa argus TaxID=215402 RepID=A0A6G1PB76_CHAAH|nr:hypothetical protein EXN66_Car003223 [Channa argus]KAK2919076.1 hypothetical protein Q8A73_003447 [Channa argus]
MDTDSPPPPPPSPPPPPLPPPSSHGNEATETQPTPCPKHAALPFFNNPPIQETNPSHAALQHDQNTQAPTMQNPLPSPPSDRQEGCPSDDDDDDDDAMKWHPVQETAPAPEALPAPQISRQEVELTAQMEMSGQKDLV